MQEIFPKNGLIRKIRLFSKFMTSQPGYQTITILTNISRTIGSQGMKFGELIKKLFFEKSYKKCDEDTIPRPFSKKSKLSISQNQ